MLNSYLIVIIEQYKNRVRKKPKIYHLEKKKKKKRKGKAKPKTVKEYSVK